MDVHYVEHGSGTPLVALHGAGVDHREIEAAIEAVVRQDGLRRIYPDLPGMGRTRVGSTVTSNADVVRLLGRFVEEVAGPALILGHSYGGYLARGVAARRPELVRGLALLCPIGEQTRDVPGQCVVRSDADAYDELEADQRADYDAYFVIRTRETARRYRDHVLPGQMLVDQETLGRIVGSWPIDLGGDAYSGPTMIIAGRRDSTAGYAGAVELLDHYPRATLAVLENAGHALPHEQPELLRALLAGWPAQ
ncbi:MAG: alpha/beta hydrolase [Microlunatus sp.]|nr:alpha/beta hydrolase [Microlunatus sp.]